MLIISKEYLLLTIPIPIPNSQEFSNTSFDPQGQKGTVVSYEYPVDYNGHNEPYYPIRDDKNTEIYEKYKGLTQILPNYYFGGRLATYVYYDMHQIIAQALNLVKQLD